MQSISPRQIKTFTMGFTEESFNEAGYAKAVAKHIGTDHTEVFVTPQMALQVIPSLNKSFSEPFADASQIPMSLLCGIAKKEVTVALSGDGGDELFGGYRRYFLSENRWRFAAKFGGQFRRKIAKLLDFLGNFSKPLENFDFFSSGHFSERFLRAAKLFRMEDIGQFYKSFVSHLENPASLLTMIDEEPLTKLDLGLNFKIFPSDLERLMFVDLISYLPDDILVKVDRSAMGVSLEARVPFLDPEIVEFSFKLPIQYKIQNGQGKIILKNLLNKYVPKSLLERKKMGFGVPLGKWLKTDLRG